jgi:hypothetical protein
MDIDISTFELGHPEDVWILIGTGNHAQSQNLKNPCFWGLWGYYIGIDLFWNNI